jgi:hypothetical protein
MRTSKTALGFMEIAFTIFLLVALFITNNFIMNVLVYAFINLVMISRVWLYPSNIYEKVAASIPYVFVLSFQINFNVHIILEENSISGSNIFSRILGTIFVLIPFYIDRIMVYRVRPSLNFPSVENKTVISYAELIESKEKIIDIIKKMGKTLSKEKINEIINDLPHHNSFRYINKGSLTNEYFELAYKTLDDLHIYIIISNTGSAASEIISLFTNKQYNHISIAFDNELKTIISYNGGERVFPPGLNYEMLEYFNKKDDSSIAVYKTKCTVKQKEAIIDKIKEINNIGSAYNLIGLVTKHTHKPNIMFCSQFVYKILKNVGLNYFNKKEEEVKPTDLIELDYYRKLEFVYEIKLNE